MAAFSRCFSSAVITCHSSTSVVNTYWLHDDARERKLSRAMQRDKALALSQLSGLEAVTFEGDIDISGKGTAKVPDYPRMMEGLARRRCISPRYAGSDHALRSRFA